MAPRALGALFALVAALCFATALAGGVVPKLVPGWWDGHPSVDGKVFERKDIHVGLLGAHGCNLGETVTCQELSTGGKLDIVGLVELAALGLIVVTGGLLARSVWKVGDRRKLLGKLVLIEVVIVAVGGGVILALGPDLKVSQHVDVPIGIGFYVFFTGVATAGLAGIVAIRVEPEPLRLKSSHTQLPAMHAQPQFDVREVLRESHQDFRPAVPPSPGGALPGPAGHLGVHQSSPPLFDNAPQLRPLYDVHNAVPAPAQPQLPVRGPTPIARAAVGAEYGIPTPPPVEPPPPHNATGPVQPMTGPQSNNATGPQVPTGSQPGPRAPIGSQPGARPKSPSVPPPPASRGKPSVPPPNRGAPMKHPTLTHAIPPPPTMANLPPPTTLPARDSNVSIPALADGPRTNVHDAMDPVTGVEIDAEAKAAAKAAAFAMDKTDRTAAAPQRTPQPGAVDPTDQLLTTARERASASELNATLARDRVSASSIDQTLARDHAKFDPNATIERPRGSSSDLNATIERPRESLSEINATVPRPRQSGTSLNDPPEPGDGPTIGGTPSAKRDQVGVATEHRAPAKPVEVPITTAPASLPPPKKVVAASSGPTPACPQCEAPMAWVEEHLRFYCSSCRMYF